MDKELLRIMIFAIGLLVILGMIAWSYLQHEKFRQDLDDYSSADAEEEVTLNDDDEFGLNSLNEPTAEKQDADFTFQDEEMKSASLASETTTATSRPFLVQFSIMAKTEQGFNGVELFNVLQEVGLEYGSLQIFERLDSRRLVDFGVASVVKPGIIPDTELASFYCPGIVFFMQPVNIDNPVAVFDDFVRTFNFVALKLDGLMLNQNRQLLTDEDILSIRHDLMMP